MSLSSFGSELAHDLLPQLRELAESRMGATNGGSTVAIMRPTGGTTTDLDGYEVPEWGAVYAALPFRIGGAWGASPSRTVSAGGAEYQVGTRIGHAPASTDLLRDGDLIDVYEGENAGSTWQFVEIDWMDQATARRFPLVATTRPQEWD